MSASTVHVELPLLLPSGPDCERCLDRLKSALSLVKGVAEASVDSRNATLQIAFDPNLATVARIEEEAKRIGAEVTAHIDHRTVDLRDLDCPDCASSIEKSVSRMQGVLWAGANFAAAQIHVEFDRDAISLDQICRVVEGHGVRACPIGPSGSASAGSSDGRARSFSWAGSLADNRRAISFLTVAILGAIAWAGPATLRVPLLALAIVIGGWPTASSGAKAIRSGSLDMNSLMTIAVVGAAAIGDWWEAASVVGLFNLGNLLQAGAMERTRRSIRGLMAITPQTAHVLRGGSYVEVPADTVAIGDSVLVKPGERIPIDGVVERGESSVNEAPITGESVPKHKLANDDVFAGTLNGSGSLEVRSSRAASDTTLSRILHRVEEAQAQRAPAQQMIDRFARIYTPLVVGAAALTAVIPPLLLSATGHAPLWHIWFLKSLALLIIACPCALVVSTPVAIVTAIGSASRRGALIKGGAFLEEIGRLKAVLFDKTGTLTTGRFEIDEIHSLTGDSESDLLAIAAAVESHSEHPLAKAFESANHARNSHRHLHVEKFESVAGLGARATVEHRRYSVGNAGMLAASGLVLGDVESMMKEREQEGKTVVVLADEERPIAIFSLSDTPRPEALAAIESLSSLGIDHQAMITGDNARAAESIAKAVGLRHWSAGLMPEQKQEYVRRAQRDFGAVALVGDGVNDAPALAASNVGIAMGAAGSDTAIETADVALMGDDISHLPFLIRLSRRATAIIRQNIAFSLITKIGLIAAAITVGLPLWLAVAGDVGVSLLVTINALRLRS